MPREQFILCILFPSFRLQALVRESPALKGQPIVLYGTSRGGPVVLEASPEAQSEGVKRGMSLVQARTRLPSLREIEAKEGRDLAYLREVAESLFALSPTVSLSPPNGVFCDMGGLHHFFGSSEKIKEVMDRILSEWGFMARGVMTPSASASWALARYGEKSWKEVSGDSLQGHLADLPVEALQVPADVCANLRRVGLERVGDVAQCPLPMLVRRYGGVGEALFARAHGKDMKGLEPFRPIAPLKSSIELPEPCIALAPLLFTAKRLLDGLQSRMRGRGVAAVRLHWLLGTEDGDVHGELALPRPQRSASVLLTILRELWGNLTLEAPVSRLSLSIPEVTEGAEETEDLWIRRVSSSETLDELMARLGAALGEGAVFSPRPAPSHRPESGVKRAPFHPPARRVRSVSEQTPGEVDPRIRPLLLLPEPEPLEWVTRFNRLYVRGRSGKEFVVKGVSGPERILGEWWKNGFARDYHRVHLDPGTLWWVFRDLQGDRWFLHGLFD